MKGWRGLWYPERSWTVPPYRTLEFWATYVLWLTAIEVFAAAVLKHPESLSLGEKFLFVTVLVGPICAALGPLKSGSYPKSVTALEAFRSLRLRACLGFASNRHNGQLRPGIDQRRRRCQGSSLRRVLDTQTRVDASARDSHPH
jgi:hypothetical protein